MAGNDAVVAVSFGLDTRARWLDRDRRRARRWQPFAGGRRVHVGDGVAGHRAYFTTPPGTLEVLKLE